VRLSSTGVYPNHNRADCEKHDQRVQYNEHCSSEISFVCERAEGGRSKSPKKSDPPSDEAVGVGNGSRAIISEADDRRYCDLYPSGLACAGAARRFHLGQCEWCDEAGSGESYRLAALIAGANLNERQRRIRRHQGYRRNGLREAGGVLSGSRCRESKKANRLLATP
jgi:hypothetical protein